MNNYYLELCYDGSKYRGWQKLGNTENTIQGKIENTLSRLLDQTIEVNASGRTDAGVHAKKQVCSFKANTQLSDADILIGLREHLPKDIGAVSLHIANPMFHARYNCKKKTYVYRVWTGNTPNIFERNYLYFLPCQLDLESMRNAASLLCGEHDYCAFTNAKGSKKSTVRNIYSIDIQSIGDEIQFIFTGDGFLYNMVRIIVGTLIEIGQGKKSIKYINEILDSKKRENAGYLVPASGLILWDVEY